jgi:hypothetical protein
MKEIKLRYQLDEDTVVKTLFDVHRIRKLSQEQIEDILSITPNNLPPLVERANKFLQKMAHLITISKLQVECEDEKYVKKHPEESQAVQEYFKKDKIHTDRFDNDIVDLGTTYEAIGKFCISTHKFFKEIAGTPGDNRSELLKNILNNLDEELQEREEDELKANRYAHRFFKKLLEKKGNILPSGVTVDDIQRYMETYIYDDEVNR